MDHLGPIEAERRRPDRNGDVKEYPPRGRQFLFEFVRTQIVRDRHPVSRR